MHLNTNYERQATVIMLTPICNALNCGGMATNLHMLEDRQFIQEHSSSKEAHTEKCSNNGIV